MNLELSHKRAIVTGGSRGIGFAIANELVKEGVSVVIAARNSEELIKAANQLTKKTKQVVIPVSVDTTDDGSVNSLVKTSVAQLGGIDILVNCAAPVAWKTKNPAITDLTGDLLVEAIDVKVMGYLRCAREVAPFMINSGWGRIINVAGMAARNANSIIGSIRNVSVVALTKNLANELQIEVEDTGDGIEEVYIDKVFDLFFSTRKEGTGVGLAIVKQIVESHGGTLGVESRLGYGANFSIRIPTVQST